MESLDNPRLIRLSKSCIGNSEKEAVLGVLDREYLGMGLEVQEFELALSRYFGLPVVAVANGTAALQLALQASGIGAGDEVLVPSLTYVASFQSICAAGATPIGCDVDLKTWLLDLDDAQKRITNKTKAIMPVHYGGEVGNLERLHRFARENNLRVIEDAAHAFGSIYKSKPVGSVGDMVCFSFDGIKNITSGEGGCVVTGDLNVVEKIKDLRLLGVEKDTENRYKGLRSWEFNVYAQGWRYHMSNIMAAIGLEQLKRLPEFSLKRQNIARQYDRHLIASPKIVLREVDYGQVVPHIYPIRIKGLKNRKSLQEKLLNLGIQSGMHYQPNHRLDFFRQENSMPMPVTDLLEKELLTLPLHPDLSDQDVEYVANSLLSLIDIDV